MTRERASVKERHRATLVHCNQYVFVDKDTGRSLHARCSVRIPSGGSMDRGARGGSQPRSASLRPPRAVPPSATTPLRAMNGIGADAMARSPALASDVLHGDPMCMVTHALGTHRQRERTVSDAMSQQLHQPRSLPCGPSPAQPPHPATFLYGTRPALDRPVCRLRSLTRVTSTASAALVQARSPAPAQGQAIWPALSAGPFTKHASLRRQLVSTL